MAVRRRVNHHPTSAGFPEPDRRALNTSLVAVLVVSLVWRVPSLFDPPWVNDEGTYFAVASAMAHGYRLYLDVWENKPPSLYLLYTAVYHLVGPSLAVIRILSTAAALGTVAVSYCLIDRFAGRGWAGPFALLTGLLLGVPFLEGTTGNAEVFLALLTATAVYLGIIRNYVGCAGLIMTFALTFKSVAAFDLVALGLWFFLHDRRVLFRYGSGLSIGLTVFLALTWRAGIIEGMLQDAAAYDFSYVLHGNGAGPPWLLLAKACVFCAIILGLRKAAFPVLWLIFAAGGALVSGRLFGHYAIQTFVPLCLCAALFLSRYPHRVQGLSRRILGTFVGLAVLASIIGWLLGRNGYESAFALRLQWYSNAVRFALGNESATTFRDSIDEHVSRNISVARLVQRMPAGSLLVWGNSPWIYVLSHRLPGTPYTSSLRYPEVPGETAALRRAIELAGPRETVVIQPALPPLGPATAFLNRNYHLVRSIQNASIYVRTGKRSLRLASASVTARHIRGTR